MHNQTQSVSPFSHDSDLLFFSDNEGHKHIFTSMDAAPTTLCHLKKPGAMQHGRLGTSPLRSKGLSFVLNVNKAVSRGD